MTKLIRVSTYRHRKHAIGFPYRVFLERGQAILICTRNALDLTLHYPTSEWISVGIIIIIINVSGGRDERAAHLRYVRQ